MSDTPSPWRRDPYGHFQDCAHFRARIERQTRSYHWAILRFDPGAHVGLEVGAAPTLAAAKHAATAALIRHAPPPF